MKQNKKTRYKQKIALTIAGLFLASPSFAIELLSNGDFESGITGWSLSYSSLADHGAYVDSMSKRTGSLGFQGYENVAPGVTLSQSVTSGSTTKTLSFLIKTVGGTGTILLDDLSVTSSGSRWTVSGYRKEVVADASNHLYLTLGDASSVELALTTSWVAFSNDFTFGPSSDDTQASLTRAANRLRASYNKISETSHFPSSNTYDCNLFDAKGMCISAGGRYTYAEDPHSHSTAGIVVLGYKVSPSIRIGGFLDQSVSNDAPTGIHISNKNPMMGAFVYWNQNPNELGYQVKLANTYQDKDLTLTRDVVGTSESGTGKTGLQTQSYVGELSYAFMYKENTLVRPYFGLRYTSIDQDAYTETGVTTPLTYSKLKDETTAALMGVKLKHQLTEKTTLIGSLGIEQDLHHKAGDFVASGLSGLTAENFSGDTHHRTRGLASLGAYYSVAKSQRLSGELMFQQLPWQNSIGGTLYANYMIGF